MAERPRDFYDTDECTCPGCIEFRRWMADGCLQALDRDGMNMRPAMLTHNLALMLGEHAGAHVIPGRLDALLEGIGRLVRRYAEKAERVSAAQQVAEKGVTVQ
jgi:hypothetical protein